MVERGASGEGTRKTRAAPIARRRAAEQTGVACATPPQGASHGARYGPPEDDDGSALAAIEAALSLALQRAAAAYDTPGCWEVRIRAALSALLDLFDERPDLARLCVDQSASARPAALALRKRTLALLVRRIDDGRHAARRQPPPHAAQAVLAGTIGAIRARLLHSDPAGLSDLLDPLMSFLVLPYRGAAASRSELTRSVPLHSVRSASPDA
jgi:hypothetical protein